MLRIENVSIEYQKEPGIIHVCNPRFSWILDSTNQNVCQKSYSIMVSTANKIYWDVQEEISGRSVLIEYGGEQLDPLTKYDVEIVVEDNYAETAKYQTSFQTGLLDSKDFKGNWISLEGDEGHPHTFLKSFTCHDDVEKAWLCVTARGLYDVTINNLEVSDDYFKPGWTNYNKRIQYQLYDVTHLVRADNRIEITVANGWYRGLLGFDAKPNNYGDRLSIKCHLIIKYRDGLIEDIVSDKTWQCYSSEISESEIYLGEIIDRNHKSAFLNEATVVDQPDADLVPQEAEPVRITKRIRPVEKFHDSKGRLIIDFGQNIAGVVRCVLKQSKGSKVTVHHGEVLDKNGDFYNENLRTAISRDVFICSGERDVFLPKFTYHGFRYIWIEGLETDCDLDNFTACALHTDMEKTNEFECSLEKVTRLYKNIEWSQRDNFLDVPTDCPQRDERLGWTGDAQVFAQTAATNFNTALFFRKWLRDLSSEQTAKYGVPHVVPNILGDQGGAAGWSDAATIIPWNLYQIYGDKRILEEQYESMSGWVDYISTRTSGKALWQKDFQYGDWIALDKEEGSDRIGATDVYLIASAFYGYSTRIVRDTARILNKEEDIAKYGDLYERIIADFNEEYITKTGRLVSETQTACTLALHFNLADEKYSQRILATLVKNLNNHNNHLVTGFLGTPYLNKALSENGGHDLSGKVFLKEDYPSWLYAVNMGATTIWERWDSIKSDGSFDESGMNSFNHYAYGSIGSWMYEYLAGIRLVEPGYRQFVIKPEPVNGITWVKYRFKCPYGMIESSWKLECGKMIVDVSIPVNTTAKLYLPDTDQIHNLGSGKYHFEYESRLDLEYQKYSFDSTVEQVFTHPVAVEILEQHAPGMTKNEMIKFVYNLSLTELATKLPDSAVSLLHHVINELNKLES